MLVHQGRWCNGDPNHHSRKGSLADKSVQLVKRKAAEDALENVFIEGEKIDNVHSFVYLGSKQQCDGDDVAEAKHRMNIAQEEFSGLWAFWQDKRLPSSLKLRMYRLAVCTTLTHGSESWTLSEQVRMKINGFNSRCLHAITGKSHRETATWLLTSDDGDYATSGISSGWTQVDWLGALFWPTSMVTHVFQTVHCSRIVRSYPWNH